MHGHARRVLVLGEMLELGELAPELHHACGREAAEAIDFEGKQFRRDIGWREIARQGARAS